MQPLALAESGDGRGQEKSAKEALSLTEGPALPEAVKASFFSRYFPLRGEKRQSLSASPTKSRSGGECRRNVAQGIEAGWRRPRAGFVHESPVRASGGAQTTYKREMDRRRPATPQRKPAYPDVRNGLHRRNPIPPLAAPQVNQKVADLPAVRHRRANGWFPRIATSAKITKTKNRALIQTKKRHWRDLKAELGRTRLN